MGQEKKVVVTRYIVKDTVEEVGLSISIFSTFLSNSWMQFIRSRQTKKLHLASLGWLDDIGEGDDESKMKGLIVSSVVLTIHLVYTILINQQIGIKASVI